MLAGLGSLAAEPDPRVTGFLALAAAHFSLNSGILDPALLRKRMTELNESALAIFEEIRLAREEFRSARIIHPGEPPAE